MFHNKKAVTLFLGFFFFLFVSELLSAASKVINSMSLDFTRNEIILAEQEQSTIKGKITYCKNPFVFIFQITEPAQQVMYINADGAFLLDAILFVHSMFDREMRRRRKKWLEDNKMLSAKEKYLSAKAFEYWRMEMFSWYFKSSANFLSGRDME